MIVFILMYRKDILLTLFQQTDRERKRETDRYKTKETEKQKTQAQRETQKHKQRETEKQTEKQMQELIQLINMLLKIQKQIKNHQKILQFLMKKELQLEEKVIT